LQGPGPTTHNRTNHGAKLSNDQSAADQGNTAYIFSSLATAVRSTWPILSTFVGVMVARGLAVAYLEGWPMVDGVHFAFVTGLPVGYGDLVPKLLLSRAIAIVLDFSGILLTGLVAAISVYSLEKALNSHTARTSETK
jgi:CBS domain containing-hemolysin-like protein